MTATAADHHLAGGEEVQPAPSAQGPQRDIRFVALPDGGFVTLWTDQLQTSFAHVVGQRYDADGGEVGDFFVADTGASQHHLNPSGTALAGGGFLVTWSATMSPSIGYAGVGGTLQGQLFDSNGHTVGAVLTLHSAIGQSRIAPQAVALASGGFVLIWGEQDESRFDVVYGQVFDGAGDQLGGEFQVEAGYIDKADIAALPGGGFVLVWDDVLADPGDNGLSNHGVRAQIFGAAGNKIGGEIAVNSTVEGTQRSPTVAGLPGDGFVVAWRDAHDPTGYRIKGQIFDSDGLKIGAEFAATPGSPDYQMDPTVAANADGEFVIGWTEHRASTEPFQSSDDDIMGRQFDSSGAPIGEAFLANVGTAGSQYRPESAMLASGGLVLGWETPAGADPNDVRQRVFFPIAQGTAGDDIFAGTAGRDYFEGLGGNDRLSGGLDDDRLFGGADDDSLDGGEGSDELDGGDGNDGIDGGAGDDRLLVSGPGTDSATGGTGSDTLVVDYSDLATGVTSSGLGATLPDGGHEGSISAFDRSVSFTGVETFEIAAGSGNDDIRTGAGDDIVSLGDGDDRVDMGTGLGHADGGSGMDGIAADLSGRGQVRAYLEYGYFAVGDNAMPFDTFVNFEYFAGVVTGSGNDTFFTTALALDDDITSGGGNDSVELSHGHDLVRAGTGSDSLSIDYSGATTDIVTTGFAASSDGTGYDGKYGTGDRSITFTGVETFSIATGSGNDIVRTGAGRDTVYTNDGDDFVDVGAGRFDSAFGGYGIDGISADISWMTDPVWWDLVHGLFGYFLSSAFGGFEYLGTLTTGSGDDIIVTSNLDRDERIDTGAGNDTVTVMNGDDVVNGGTGGIDALIIDYRDATTSVVFDTLTLAAVDGYDGRVSAGDRAVDFTGIERFSIVGGSAADNLRGGDRMDVLNGGGGIDTMAGGLDGDYYVVDHASDLVIEYAGEGTDTISTGLAVYSLVATNVENLTATSDASHDFRGNAFDNVVTGGGGADVLRLYDGGNDTVFGGSGNDILFFIGALNAGDTVNGGEGNDTLVLQGNYAPGPTLSATVTQIENVSFLGGNNTNFGEPGTNRYDYILTIHDANFAAGVQARINGAALLAGEDFTFDGSAETDAKFVVYGGKGKDTLLGGLGHDIFFYAEERFASGDTVNGGAGYDGMFLRGNYTIDFNAPGYTGLFTSIENLTLTSATDERYARGGGTEFDYNLALSNALVGVGETLTVSGALLMASETMVLDGSLESDGLLRLFGGKAADTLKGGGQADILHGNLGADQLTGNGGADTFLYHSTAESNSASRDQILDFTPGTDKIDLSRIDASTLAAGNQAFTWIGSNAFSGTAGQLRAFQSGGTWIVEGDTNGDGAADLVIALTLQGATPLGAGDFLL